MIYPGVIMSVAAIAISVLLIFVIPVFQSMFASVNLVLPFPTRARDWDVGNPEGYWYIIIAGAGAGFYGLKKYYATSNGQLTIDRSCCTRPSSATCSANRRSARFTRTARHPDSAPACRFSTAWKSRRRPPATA